MEKAILKEQPQEQNLTTKKRKKFFAVQAKCGHVGKTHCIWITFPVMAWTKQEAADLVRKKPRVKKHHKDVIRALEEISYEEYRALKDQNARNPYLFCKNVQEQAVFEEIGVTIQEDPTRVPTKEKHQKNKEARAYKMRKRELSFLSRCEYVAA